MPSYTVEYNTACVRADVTCQTVPKVIRPVLHLTSLSCGLCRWTFCASACLFLLKRK